MDNFWSGKKVLLTGGSGFLGSHVLDEFGRKGISNIVVPESKGWNLTSEWRAAELFRAVRPDIVIHLAARVGGIQANMENPAPFFHENLMMGVNVLESSRRYGVKKVVLIGTTCSYPKFGAIPFSEENFWEGYPEETNAPYGIAKKAIFEMGAAYHAQYGMSIIRLIPTNLFGERDHFDSKVSHVIPALIKKFVDAKEQNLGFVDVWGDGTVSREFLYVKDCAEAIVMATEKYNEIDLVNIGAGFEMPISVLARKISEIVGFYGTIEWEPFRPNGQPRRMLNTERAERFFGWKATTPFDEGLRRTIRWYLAHRVA